MSLKLSLHPTSTSELRSVLRLCEVYRRFVDNFGHKAGSLHTLFQKNTPKNFTLSEEQTKPFRDLIDTILSPPAMAILPLALKGSVDTDALSYGLGCSLHKTTLEDERQTIVYWSRSLVPAE